MRKEEGKSSIRLILIITAIIIVAIMGINAMREFMDGEKVKSLQADMLIVKTKVETLKGKNTLNPEENPLRGHQLTQIPENIDIKEFLEKNVITTEEYEKYYLLDDENLRNMELQDLINKYDGYFIVNYDSFDVVYSEGYKNENGVWCYKISDLEKESKIENEVKNITTQLDEQIVNEQTSQEKTEETATTEQIEENTEQSEER